MSTFSWVAKHLNVLTKRWHQNVSTDADFAYIEPEKNINF
jgi:hypothetical protein